MRRIAMLCSLAALALAGACSEDRTSSATEPAALQPRASLEIVPVCVSAGAITALINDAFTNGSPDENSALGKWDNIQKQYAAYLADRTPSRLNLVQEKTLDLVDFMLDKKNEGKLLYGADQASLDAFRNLINALFCFAELQNLYFYPGGNAWLVYPSDLEQSLVGDNQQVALHLPANAVKSPSLIAITRSSADLVTKFDQYGQTYEFSKYPIEDFDKPVVPEICTTVETQQLFDELVLGHTKADGTFELLPRQPSRLSCTQPPATGTASLGDRLLSMLLPRKLYAAVMFGGGGVAGSLIELSPVRPVDPRVFVEKVNPATSAPIGTLVDPAPTVRLRTRNNTPFDGVRVDFTTLGGTYGAGGTLASSGSVTTDADGLASVAWRVGTTADALYGLSATPQAVADANVTTTTNAVPGTEFVDPVTTFEVLAKGPAGLAFTTSPEGKTYTAGTTLDPLTVRVVDDEGRTVVGYAGSIAVSATPGPIVSTTTLITTTNGVALFNALVINRSGNHTLTATAAPGGFTRTTGSFSIAKDVPRISIAGGNNQTATAPATLNGLQVLVEDRFGNKYEGTTVFWRTFDGSTPGQATTTTVTGGAAAGTSANSWTIREGVNQLYASLDSDGLTGNRFVMFSATGTVPRRTESVLTCGVGNSRVGITDHYVRMASPARVDKITMYFSVQGDASEPTFFPLVMILEEQRRINGQWETTPREIGRATRTVPLRGNTAQNDGSGTFDFGAGVSPASGSRLIIKVRKGTPEVPGTLRFNAGTGSGCDASTFRNDNSLFRTSAAIVVQGTR